MDDLSEAEDGGYFIGTSHCWNPKSILFRRSYTLKLVPPPVEVLEAIKRGRKPPPRQRVKGR